ncbi:MAG: hypothetical protein ACXVW3_13965 [Nocardioidaceae bacterium]
MPTEEVTAAAAGTGTLGDRTVNRMGFGSMRITADPDRALAVRVLRRAVDMKREDDELVRVCAERGIAFVPFSAIAGGGSRGRRHLGPHRGANAPPFLVAHGDHDTLVPAEGARAFVERLRSVSTQPVVYAELPGAQRSFDVFHSLRFDAVVDAAEAFTAWARSRCPAR